MNTYTYHKDIRTILAAVGNVFGGIVIPRMSDDKEDKVVDNIVVPVVYAPKTRTLNELVNTSKHIKLPIMCYDLKTVQYDADRNFNKLDGYLVPNKIDWTNTTHPMPLPVKMSLTSSFICRFQEDYHQYITCLFTYFSPYVEISYKHPDIDVEVRCRVIWDGNANVEIPEQFTATEPYRAIVNAGFTVESWLFKNDERKVNIIYNIPTTFTALADIVGNQSQLGEMQEFNVNTDGRVMEGRPKASYTSTTVVDVGRDVSEILIKGDMFEKVTDVALVDMDPDPNSRMYDVSKYKLYSWTFADGRTYFHSYDDNGRRIEEFRSGTAYKVGTVVMKDMEFYRCVVECKENVPISDSDFPVHFEKVVGRKPYGPFSGGPAVFEFVDDHRLIVKIPKAENGGRFDVYVIGKCGYGRLSEDSARAYMSVQPETTAGIMGVKISGD